MRRISPLQRAIASRGFTLTELLVSITIIAIMAAILFPVFAQARGKARQATCQSNVRQIGVAFLMYAQDNDEIIPCKQYVLTPTRRERLWFSAFDWDIREHDFGNGFLSPYVKNAAVWLCPSAAGLPVEYHQTSHYGYNEHYLYHYDVETTGRPGELREVEAPAETILMADSGLYRPDKQEVYTSLILVEPSFRYWPSAQGRHQGFANVIWFDGHVKSLQVAPRTKDTTTDLSALRKNNLGDLLKNGVRTGNPLDDDFYFQLDKPGL